jgi:hypothetical protein
MISKRLAEIMLNEDASRQRGGDFGAATDNSDPP